jgi:hypothetical protein
VPGQAFQWYGTTGLIYWREFFDRVFCQAKQIASINRFCRLLPIKISSVIYDYGD